MTLTCCGWVAELGCKGHVVGQPRLGGQQPSTARGALSGRSKAGLPCPGNEAPRLLLWHCPFCCPQMPKSAKRAAVTTVAGGMPKKSKKT